MPPFVKYDIQEALPTAQHGDLLHEDRRVFYVE